MLRKLGFREEGLLKRYLEVDGDWRDHVVLAVTAEDASPTASSVACCGPGAPPGPERPDPPTRPIRPTPSTGSRPRHLDAHTSLDL